jgi:uncharacterized NAD(P)/FAD-binding protein YdhS
MAASAINVTSSLATRPSSLQVMLDWLIVGGGVHGVHHALNLLTVHRVARETVRIVDPFPELLARWTECTDNTGMRFLRSPLVHNLDAAPFALRHFARDEWKPPRLREHFLGPYKRPSLEAFRAHAEHLVQKHRLRELHIRGAAAGMSRAGRGVRVATTAGAVETKRVLLALGMSDQPDWPVWARELRAAGGTVDHVFDPGFRRGALPEWTEAVVVGGGITAAQTAMALAERQPGTVTLLMRHSLRVRQFDSPPAYIGPRYLAGFNRESDPAVRRGIIRDARFRGSVPPDVASAFRRAIASGSLRLVTADVTEAHAEGGGMRLALADVAGAPAGELRADRIVLATGFGQARPGGAWLDAAVTELGLPCAPCGFPLVDRSLRWAPGVYVTGPLAELEIGPVARNIIGARLAAERLPRAA